MSARWRQLIGRLGAISAIPVPINLAWLTIGPSTSTTSTPASCRAFLRHLDGQCPGIRYTILPDAESHASASRVSKRAGSAQYRLRMARVSGVTSTIERSPTTNPSSKLAARASMKLRTSTAFDCNL